MERFIHVMLAGALVCATQAALSQTTNQRAADSRDPYVNVAAMGQAAERHAASEAQVKPRIESLLEATGLAGSGPFPSRGGPLD